MFGIPGRTRAYFLLSFFSEFGKDKDAEASTASASAGAGPVMVSLMQMGATCAQRARAVQPAARLWRRPSRTLMG